MRTYSRESGAIRPATRLEFTSASEAEEVGAALAVTSAAVLVYGCEVADGVEVLGEIEIFAGYGDVKDVLAA